MLREISTRKKCAHACAHAVLRAKIALSGTVTAILGMARPWSDTSHVLLGAWVACAPPVYISRGGDTPATTVHRLVQDQRFAEICSFISAWLCATRSA